MRIIESLEQLEQEIKGPTHVAVGTFDGVHLGHRTLTDRLAAEAQRESAQVLVFTFRNHPRSVVSPGNCPPLLSPWPMKRRLIESLAVDVLVGIEFTAAFSSTSAEDFVARVLVDKCKATRIVSGRNFRFGRGGTGGPALLAELAPRLGCRYDVVEPLQLENDRISSTRIRDTLARGDVAAAARMMGRTHQITAPVAAGDAIGRTIGFPTANLRPDDEQFLPADGVYAVMVFIDEDPAPRPAMMNIGERPTVGGREHRAEVHLIDYSGDLYSSRLTVCFVARTRDEKRFSGPDELAAQLGRDRDQCRAILDGLDIRPV